MVRKNIGKKQNKKNHIIFAIIVLTIIFVLINEVLSPKSIEMQEVDDYDVVIVGAGLSGLSSAFNLNNYNVLILEKEDYAGGRVLTITKNNLSYDLGAVFSYNPQMLPFEINSSNQLVESGSVGLFYNNNTYFCDIIIDCIKKVNLANDNSTFSDLMLNEESKNILNSFFQTIHPGEIENYIIERQEQDSLKKYNINYYKKGNKEIITEYLRRVNAKIQFNSLVTSVDDIGEKVKIEYFNKNRTQIVFSRTVIVTTPAPIAKKLIKKINKNSEDFLNSVKYGQMIVIAVGIENHSFENFSYLVTPDLMTTTIIKHTEDNKSVILSYITDLKSKKVQNKTDEEIILTNLNILKLFEKIEDENILFKDIHRWWYAGTIISEEIYENLKSGYDKPSNRVFLAGDYTYLDTRIPYGMYSAVKSGENVANKISFFLNNFN